MSKVFMVGSELPSNAEKVGKLNMQIMMRKLPDNFKEFIEQFMSRDAFTHILVGVLVDKYRQDFDYGYVRTISANSLEYASKNTSRMIVYKMISWIGINASTGVPYIDDAFFNIAAGLVYKYIVKLLSDSILPVWVSNNMLIPWRDLVSEAMDEGIKEFGTQLMNASWDMILTALPKTL